MRSAMADFVGRPNFVHPNVALGWEKPAPPHGLLDIMMTAPVAMLIYLGLLAIPGMAGPAHNVSGSRLRRQSHSSRAAYFCCLRWSRLC